MPRPDSTLFADAVYLRLAPIATQDEALGWPLLTYIIGLSRMFENMESIVRSGDGRAPYSPLLDAAACPVFALPFLAQIAGVKLRAQTTGETLEAWAVYARDAILRRNGRHRGRPDAMIAAIQQTLTGSKEVRLLERVGGDAYAVTVITRPSETPNAAAALAAMLTQKPAGIIVTMTQSDLPLILEGTRTINAATGTIDAATLANVT